LKMFNVNGIGLTQQRNNECDDNKQTARMR